MGLFDRERDAFSEAVTELKKTAADLRIDIAALTKQKDYTAQVRSLREEIETLTIAKERLEEENARKIREVTHQVGLERRRQEAEAEQAKRDVEAARREATLAVREENLKAERDAFTHEMKFREERFTQEVGYLKDLMEKILGRLPDVSMTIEQSSQSKERKGGTS